MAAFATALLVDAPCILVTSPQRRDNQRFYRPNQGLPCWLRQRQHVLPVSDICWHGEVRAIILPKELLLSRQVPGRVTDERGLDDDALAVPPDNSLCPEQVIRSACEQKLARDRLKPK